MKKILALALAVLMMVGMFTMTSCGNANPAENNTKIKIAMTGPLTGGAAIYGVAVKNSAHIVVGSNLARRTGLLFDSYRT